MSIVLRLAGGFGNQLFQLVFAGKLSEISNRLVYVNYDGLSSYSVNRSSTLAHELFPRLFNSNFIDLNAKSDFVCTKLSNLRIGRFVPFLGINDSNCSQALRSSLSLIPDCLPIFVDGYFQDLWKSYDHFNEAVKLIPSLPLSEKYSYLKSSKYCVVHVRGGDFLKVRQHNVCDLNFYQSAFRKAIDLGCEEFLVVSDDLAYATELSGRLRATLVDMFKSIEVISDSDGAADDFMALHSASFRIIGNSTFGFWSAALSHGTSTTISSPYKFFNTISRRFERRRFKFPNELWID